MLPWRNQVGCVGTSTIMSQRIVLGVGSGRCGTWSLASILDKQPNAHVTHQQVPLLPWRPIAGHSLEARFARMRKSRSASVVGDVGSFYLPYLEDAIRLEPDIRIVCLQRDREEVVSSFCRWLDTVHMLPTNHWATCPAPGWYHEPVWTRIFPQYDTTDREEGIRRYWDEYYTRAEQLASRYPDHVRIFDTHSTLNSVSGVNRILSFVGIAPEDQIPLVATTLHRSEDKVPSARSLAIQSWTEHDNRRCVILVPHSGQIVPECENALRQLETRGYTVRRVGGYAAIDQARNQMVTDALRDGFEETMWIDSDVGFDADDVDRLRCHKEPVVCGIYPKKGRRELACHVLPGTLHLSFGEQGGLQEICYAGAGFLLVKRHVYEMVQQQLNLPVCNERFGSPMIPFFEPLILPHDDGHWYLAEDYAFSQRARDCGFRIMADTGIRLWHVGTYGYGWEDAGHEVQRLSGYKLHLEG